MWSAEANSCPRASQCVPMYLFAPMPSLCLIPSLIPHPSRDIRFCGKDVLCFVWRGRTALVFANTESCHLPPRPSSPLVAGPSQLLAQSVTEVSGAASVSQLKFSRARSLAQDCHMMCTCARMHICTGTCSHVHTCMQHTCRRRKLRLR